MANRKFGWHSGAVHARSLAIGSAAGPQSSILSAYASNASTSASSSVEPFYLKSTMTGVGGVGGRARFHLYTNVALGGWSNALKAYAEYGASGRTTGLGSAFCAEMTLSAGTSSGTYAPLESELILGSGALTGTTTSFLYMAVSGADKATMDSNGYLFDISGVTANTGKLYSEAATAATGDATLRIRINGVAKYLLVADDAS